MHLELNGSEYKVSAGGLTIELLPKEFALLQFLYRNRGRTFSREQLLDKVWPMEYPVERTVDDHIYRLRKKLRDLGGIDIKTIRGFGYSLAVQGSPEGVAMNPATNDPELRNTMSEVFMKFHIYGQGKSMLTLARQQDILGYELDPHYSMVVHFVQGDLEWLIYTDEVPLKDRLFYLNLFYFFIGDPKVKMEYAERLIEKNLLNPPEQLELEILTMLDLYTLAGQPEKALERLKRSYQVIAEPDFENFVPATQITELFIHLVAGTGDEQLERMDETVSRTLRDKPFLREIGGYKVVKGLWALRRAQWAEGEKLIHEGLQVLDMSGFVPLRFYSVYRIYHFCRMYLAGSPLGRKYESLFTAELEAFGLLRLELALENLLLPLLESP
ncbi:winged helix family transcriptional regulator [Paenibacillus sp. LMG 31459]|uniref:Winged helix family transcriptional regulator n=1 Tax=Paenibacillus phytohabitans TaxID=2654978 RepID=A0ABX1YGT4_9BACL|nr:winged helix-turn-helix domain-containing protein [Paenibacillus phytohabitans]NOU79569.1 winged helix family transcriptional regulator [Paenibacillus phytohabitans]